MTQILPKGSYKDPLDVLLEKEARSCKGCAYATKIFGRSVCMKSHTYGRKCRSYEESVVILVPEAAKQWHK